MTYYCRFCRKEINTLVCPICDSKLTKRWGNPSGIPFKRKDKKEKKE
jgi:hypothetical protein